MIDAILQYTPIQYSTTLNCSHIHSLNLIHVHISYKGSYTKHIRVQMYIHARTHVRTHAHTHISTFTPK